MDKIRHFNPIRARRVNQPVVFAFNILVNHFIAHKTRSYHMVEKMIKHNNPKNFLLLPNITNISMDIEERGHLLAQEIEKVSNKYQSKVHVISHSFTGVDARAAISMHGAGEHVQSLSTICTPH